eukprot:gnl/MRDRNA2_/MRDRNA2_105320_c0_seq1.p1 gnl/MRDRNA2_/MRDRNA2_105320_c0~~gnl/MRDRNA2_/MRDRNA2_105320_c0_seq1.p1  ORF type:complete len:1150 (+),score=207.07 gnl/MRDRNA2_/MRDRNA2_105320_c0_seq1:157-3606(+)
MAARIKAIIVLISIKCQAPLADPLGGSLSLVDAEAGPDDGPDEGPGLIPLDDAEPLVPATSAQDRLWKNDFQPAGQASSGFLSIGAASSASAAKVPRKAAAATHVASHAISGDPLGIITMNLPLPPQPKQELFGGNPLWTASSDYASRKASDHANASNVKQSIAPISGADGNGAVDANDLDSAESQSDDEFTGDVNEDWRASEQRILRLARKTASILYNTTDFTKLGKPFSVLVAGTNQMHKSTKAYGGQVSESSTAYRGEGNTGRAARMHIDAVSKNSGNTGHGFVTKLQHGDPVIHATTKSSSPAAITEPLSTQVKHVDPVTHATTESPSPATIKELMNTKPKHADPLTHATAQLSSSSLTIQSVSNGSGVNSKPFISGKKAPPSSQPPVLKPHDIVKPNNPDIPDPHRRSEVPLHRDHNMVAQHTIKKPAIAPAGATRPSADSLPEDSKVTGDNKPGHKFPLEAVKSGHHSRAHPKVQIANSGHHGHHHGHHGHHGHQHQHNHHRRTDDDSHHHRRDHHEKRIQQKPQQRRPDLLTHKVNAVAQTDNHSHHQDNTVQKVPEQHRRPDLSVHRVNAVANSNKTQGTNQQDDVTTSFEDEVKEARRGSSRFHLAQALAPDVPIHPVSAWPSDPVPSQQRHSKVQSPSTKNPSQQSYSEPPSAQGIHSDALHLSPMELKAFNIEETEGPVMIPESSLKTMPLPTANELATVGPQQWEEEARAQPVDHSLHPTKVNIESHQEKAPARTHMVSRWHNRLWTANPTNAPQDRDKTQMRASIGRQGKMPAVYEHNLEHNLAQMARDSLPRSPPLNFSALARESPPLSNENLQHDEDLWTATTTDQSHLTAAQHITQGDHVQSIDQPVEEGQTAQVGSGGIRKDASEVVHAALHQSRWHLWESDAKTATHAIHQSSAKPSGVVHAVLHQSRWHLWDAKTAKPALKQSKATTHSLSASKNTAASPIYSQYLRQIRGEVHGSNVSQQSHVKEGIQEPIAMLDSPEEPVVKEQAKDHAPHLIITNLSVMKEQAKEHAQHTLSASNVNQAPLFKPQEKLNHKTLTDVEEQAFAVEGNPGAQPRTYLTFALDHAISEADAKEKSRAGDTTAMQAQQKSRSTAASTSTPRPASTTAGDLTIKGSHSIVMTEVPLATFGRL